MRKVIPTVFAYTKKEFNERLGKVKKVSKIMQVDFMDGRLTGRKGISISDVPRMKGCEAHLMVASPERWLPGLKKKGFKKVLFHYESHKDEDSCYNLIFCGNRLGLEMFVVFNPGTSLGVIKKFVGRVKGIMFMGVVPGKENQKFQSKVLDKIKVIRKMSSKIVIQVDGGVNPVIVGKLKKAGADIVNSGSFVSESDNPRKALSELRKRFR